MGFDLSKSLLEAAEAMMKKHPANCDCPACVKARKMSEEVEQVDEISKGTLSSYIEKAATDKSKQSTKIASDDTKSADRWKAVEKSGNRTRGIQKAVKRLTQEETVSEEQIDEISKKTLGSYITKAGTKIIDTENKHHADPHGMKNTYWHGKSDDEIKKDVKKHNNRINSVDLAVAKGGQSSKHWNPSSKPKVKVMATESLLIVSENTVGEILEINEDNAIVVFEGELKTISLDDIILEEIENVENISENLFQNDKFVALKFLSEETQLSAKEQLMKMAKAENEESMKKSKAMNDSLDKQFKKEAPKILSTHGYDSHSSHETGDTYTKKHDNGHVSMIHIKNGDSYYGSKHSVSSSNTKGMNWSHSPHSGVYSEKECEKCKVDMMPKFEQHVMAVKNSTDNSW